MLCLNLYMIGDVMAPFIYSLQRVPAIHLLNARFKECIGDIPNAHVAFTHCDTDSDTGFVENVVMKANMERRLGNVVAASNTFKEAIEKAAAKGKFHILPILYVHGSRLTYVTTNSEDAARDILIDGIKRVPCCKLLIEELIKFAMAHKGSSHINVVDSVVSSAISPSAGVSQGLSVTDGEHISRLYIELVDLCGTARDVRKAWNRHARLFPHSVRTTFCPVTGTKRWKVSKEEKQEVLDTLPSQESGNGMSDCVVQSSMQEKQHLVETPDNQIAHPPTDQAPDQKSPLLESHDMVSDPSTFKPCESGASDDNEKMRVDFISLKDSEEQPGEDDQKPNVYVEMRLDCISLKDSAEQPGEDDPEANVSLDSAHRVTNATEGPQAALEISKENDLQEQSDLEPQQDLKPPSLEGLSLDTQDARSPGPLTPKSYDFEAPQGIGPFPSTSGKCEAIQELSFSSGSIRRNEAYEENSMSCGSLPVSGRHANVDHLISSPSSSQATVSTQINTGSVSPSTSASNVNTMASAPPGPQMFERIGKNWRQRSNPDRIRRDSKFGFRGNSHKRLHQQGQATPRQHFPQAERGSQLPMSQGYSSQPLSSQSPHRQQGSQVHNQYCTPVAHPNITSPQAWSVQNTQQQNLSAVCQSQPTVQPGTFPQAQMSQYPLQSNEQHGTTQNNQVYNQMWQYYYYQQQQQQQLLWQQQQQPQQQQLLQQQYQQQMLQLEYLQQQQLPYQQQQEQLQMLFQQHQQQLLLQQQQLQSQPQQAFHLPQQLLQQQTTQQLQIQQEHLLYLQQQQQQLQQQLQQQHQQMAPTLQKQHEQEQVELEPQINRSQIQGGAASPHDTKPSRTVESCEAPRPHPLGSK